jgi:hypothetical protein
MKIKVLKANFRGARNYMHSATVLNHIYDDNNKFKEVKFHKITSQQIEFCSEKKDSLFGEIYFNNNQKNKNIIYMNQTNIPITTREKYFEDEIINMVSQKNNKLIFKTLTKKFTFFDITIAMIKQLNYIQYPSEKKWIAASYKLFNNKIDFFPKYKITVEIDKHVSGKFSNNSIFYNSSKVAESKFFLT